MTRGVLEQGWALAFGMEKRKRGVRGVRGFVLEAGYGTITS